MRPLHRLATGPHQISLSTLTGKGAPKTFGRLPRRYVYAGAVLTAEICTVAAFSHPWLHTTHLLQGPIVFFAALLFFGRKSFQAKHLYRQPVGDPFITLHLAAFTLLFTLEAFMLHASARGLQAPIPEVIAWFFCLIAMAASLFAILIPPVQMPRLARRLGRAWAYAAICAFLTLAIGSLEFLAWNATNSWLGERLASGAFHGVALVLGLFYDHIIANPATRILGTSTFVIHVADSCSGIEGLALTFVLTAGWLIYERRHLRLRLAFWLVPLALTVIWFLNILRIAALVIIGAHGHAKLALSGFHTEAGWIIFTSVAVGFLIAANSIPWLRKTTAMPAAHVPHDDIATPYILPFVAILAVSLFTRAVSTGFETLYALRLLAVFAIFWAYHKRYHLSSWDFRITDVASGAAVGIVWILVGHFTSHEASSTIADGLARLHPAARSFWLLTRIMAATITVPFAEELAFRGYLSRRLMSEKVESISFSRLTLFSMAGSSLAFGALHGSLWPVGTLAGLVFALVARRRNSLGAAFAAHAVANLVLALWVLHSGEYFLW